MKDALGKTFEVFGHWLLGSVNNFNQNLVFAFRYDCNAGRNNRKERIEVHEEQNGAKFGRR